MALKCWNKWLLIALAFILMLAKAGQAAVTITVEQNGTDVELIASGNINLTGLDSRGQFAAPKGLSPVDALLLMGPATGDFERYGTAAGPSFGDGEAKRATSGSGDIFGFDIPNSQIAVPADYQSFEQINATLTFANETIESLGIKPGTYRYTLSNDDFIQLNVVPIPAALPLLGSGLVVLGAFAAQTKRKTRQRGWS